MNDADAKREAIAEMGAIAHEKAQRFLTDAEFAKRFRKLVKIAKATFERDSYHDMMIFAYLQKYDDSSDNERVPIHIADWQPDNKYEKMIGLGVKIAQDYPDRMLIMLTQISEGWMAQYKPEQVPKDGFHFDKGVQTPSERDDKLEVLMVSGITIDQRQSYANFEIVRTPKGKWRRWGKVLQKLYSPNDTLGPEPTGNILLAHVFMGFLSGRKEGRS